MNKFGGIIRDVCGGCRRHARTHTNTLTHTHTHTPALLSRPPNFRGSHGMSSSAIQLRISVLQLNSAIPEQNERPKPSGEKVLTTLIYKVLLGILCPCNHLPSVKEVCVRVRACVCVCTWERRRGSCSAHTIHFFVDRARVTSAAHYLPNYSMTTYNVIPGRVFMEKFVVFAVHN